jgi:hypothetical protein
VTLPKTGLSPVGTSGPLGVNGIMHRLLASMAGNATLP